MLSEQNNLSNVTQSRFQYLHKLSWNERWHLADWPPWVTFPGRGSSRNSLSLVFLKADCVLKERGFLLSRTLSQDVWVYSVNLVKECKYFVGWGHSNLINPDLRIDWNHERVFKGDTFWFMSVFLKKSRWGETLKYRLTNKTFNCKKICASRCRFLVSDYCVVWKKEYRNCSKLCFEFVLHYL